ncbi:hypothetical protein EVG20_g6978 [Dentipellis fragilis]|uniref:Uncharacterized protein n=1 Tax=Dentipellis fragilis TaxID=205917 RepID=A0A4Y9YHM2_9AGAM|nr:hypothetical protein EVG20_g6978 [Dentipellis fragilis]
MLWHPPQRGEKRQWPLIVYTCLLFVLGIVFISMDMHLLQADFIDNREFPGGPMAYSMAHYGDAETMVPNVSAIIAGWLADGFLLYRCLVIFQMKIYVVSFPILIYLTGIATSILFLFHTSQPGASLFNESSVNFGVIYFSLSAGLNVTITGLITWRLLSFRRAVKSLLGDEHAALGPYGSIAAMVTESSLMYAVVAVMLAVPYALGNFVSNLFLAPWTQVQILSPMLIIFRVTKGRAWDARTASNLTTMRFQEARGRGRTTGSDSGQDIGGLEPHDKNAPDSAIASQNDVILKLGVRYALDTLSRTTMIMARLITTDASPSLHSIRPHYASSSRVAEAHKRSSFSIQPPQPRRAQFQETKTRNCSLNSVYTYLGESFPPSMPESAPHRFRDVPLELPVVNYVIEDSSRFTSTAPQLAQAWSVSLKRQHWGYVYLGAQRRKFALAMFHQYHCVALFAHSLARRSGIDGHSNHCMNYVRQHVLCEADRTLEEPDWGQVGAGWYGNGTTRKAGKERQCKDWSILWEIVRDNHRDWLAYKDAHKAELVS